MALMIRDIRKLWNEGELLTSERFGEIRQKAAIAAKASGHSANFAWQELLQYWREGERAYREMHPHKAYWFKKPRVELFFVCEKENETKESGLTALFSRMGVVDVIRTKLAISTLSS